MESLVAIVLLALEVLTFVVLAHVIMSWLISFNVLNPRQEFVAMIWQGLNRLLDPFYSRIRQFMPNTGALDLSPLVLFFGIYALRIIISNNF
ncbi:MAG: YggT family protein [Rhodobacteraceae bacterium]|nr:YggT family protein [Paracoccaceae bacterium]